MQFEEDEVYAQLNLAGIPQHMQGGIVNYLCYYVEAGSFLNAVFENSFVDVVAQADDNNREILMRYAQLLYNYLPSRAYDNCPWGSPENVKAWLAKRTA